MYYDVQDWVIAQNGKWQFIVWLSLWILCRDKWSIVMQYTWLKDKNWKEIYEGDIQKITLWKYYWIYVVEAIWWQFWNTLFSICKEHNIGIDDDGNYTFEAEKWDCLLRDFVKHWKDCEIIWNIYENPELIK
jgi:uncharacterized phage protein (TIGR01671 family)